MGTPQTLDHFLDGSENSIRASFIAAFTDPRCAPKQGTSTYPPVGISLYWASRGEGSMRSFHGKEGPMVCATPITTGVENLVSEIRKRIHAHVGESPIGSLRIRCFVKGASDDPLFDRTGTIVPADTFGLVDPSHSLVLSELAETRKQRDMAIQAMIAMNASVGQILVSQQSTIATLATARTAGAAGSDLGSIGAIAGVILLIVGFPAIKAALGVPQDATAADLVVAVRRTLMEAVSGDNRPGASYERDAREALGLRQLPPGVGRPDDNPDADPAPKAIGVTASASSSGAVTDDTAAVMRLLDRAEREPAFREELMKSVLDNPTIADAARDAFMRKMGLA